MSGSVEPQQQMRPNSLTAVHLERFSRPLLNLVHGDAWTNVSLWRDGESHHPQMKKTVAKPPRSYWPTKSTPRTRQWIIWLDEKNYPWESLHWPKNSFETWDLCLRSLNKTCKVLAPFPFDWALSFMMVCDVKTVFSVIAVNKIQNVGSHMPPLARQQKGEKKTKTVLT